MAGRDKNRETTAPRLLEADRLTWLVCALLAAVLLAVAAFLPLWHMNLEAPQYPAGLEMTAYGTRIEGDIEEINSLNHYVGAAPVHPDSIRELDLFPYALVGLIVAVVVGAFLARRRLLRLLLGAAVWGFAIGFLVDLQWWLYKTGHGLNEDAPMRIDSFTPKVIGTTQVVNFRSEAMVGVGFWLIVVAALLITAGPSVFRFFKESWQNTGQPAASGGTISVRGRRPGTRPE